MKKIYTVSAILLCCIAASGQSKIIKEVVGQISSQFKEIRSNKQVIGYANLVQLEKASKDSFNYVLSIMDENLNDINTIKFRETDLILHGIAFENDILCLALRKSLTNKKYSTTLYFVNLEGQILQKITQEDFKYATSVKIINVPQTGFACEVSHYETNSVTMGNSPARMKKTKTKLIVYDSQGKMKWEKENKYISYGLNASSKVVGQYDLRNNKVDYYDVKDGGKMYSVEFPKIKGYYGMIQNTEVFGDTLISTGAIEHFSDLDRPRQYKEIKHGMQKGVFVLKAWSAEKSGVKLKTNIWADGEQSEITKKTASPEDKNQLYYFSKSTSDKDGNTYFFAHDIHRKTRVGNIVVTVVTLPTVIFPILCASTGYSKYSWQNATIFKMTPKGGFYNYITLSSDKSPYYYGKLPFDVPYESFSMNSADGSNPYFIANTVKDFKVVNLTSKKPVSISKKQGDIYSSIYPAKEGHFLLSEYNSKEKTNKLSVVQLQ